MKNNTSKIHKENSNIKPMNFAVSILYFGIPAIFMIIGFHVIMPALIKHGLSPFYAYFVGLGTPLALMIAASMVAFVKEGNMLTWKTLSGRFRLYRLSGKMWLFTIAAFIGIIILYGIAIKLNMALINSNIIPMPESLPAWLDTSKEVSLSAMDQAFGGLSGNIMALFAFLVFLFLNIIGEEFWWRGYILPRQELAFGKHVWYIHGLMWAFFHAFKWWDILSIIPLTLILTFIVWKFKNNTIGIILHFLINGIGLIPIILGILST